MQPEWLGTGKKKKSKIYKDKRAGGQHGWDKVSEGRSEGGDAWGEVRCRGTLI